MSTLQVAFEEQVGWVLSGVEPGPAGTASLVLEGARLSVDADDPSQVVELVLWAERPGDPLEPAAHDLAALVLAPGGLDQVLNGARQVTAADSRSGVGLLAHAELLLQRERTAPRLAALDAVAAGAALPMLHQHVRQHAWSALPAVNALGRAASLHPELVDELTERARDQLRERVSALRGVLTDAGWDEARSPAVRDLADLLAGVDSGFLWDLELATAAERVRSYNADPRLPVTLRWSAATEDIAPRLGEVAAWAYSGALARGQAPGRFAIDVPLAPGAPGTELFVRVHGWDGTVLASGPLTVTSDQGGLGTASARLELGELEGSQRDAAVRHGVFVDVHLMGLPALDGTQLRSLARSRAMRAAQDALLARRRGRAGEEDAWRRCAALLAAVGDEDGAGAAGERAEQAAAARSAPMSGEPDWLGQLLVGWQRRADEVLSGRPSLDRLRPVLRDLAVAVAASPELARLHAAAAHAVLAEDPQDDESVASAHLSEALRLWLQLGDEGEASAVMRDLDALPEPAEEP